MGMDVEIATWHLNTVEMRNTKPHQPLIVHRRTQ